MRLGQFCENFENTRENLSLILLGLMRLHILSEFVRAEINIGAKALGMSQLLERYIDLLLKVEVAPQTTGH